MAYEVMRHSKVKRSGVSGTDKHNRITKEGAAVLRAKEVEMSGKSYICPENVRYNRTLVECDCTFNEKVKELLQKNGIGKVRKDATMLIDGVYTYSLEATPNLIAYFHKEDEDWKKDHEEMWEAYAKNPNKKEDVKKEWEWALDYFKACVEHENARYGVCISAVVHFHEGTPHLHTSTVPLVVDQEKGKVRLSAKDVLGNKAHLSYLQSCFHTEVGERYGLERGVVREPGEIRKHMTKEQKRLQEMEQQLKEMQQQRATLSAELKAYQEQIDVVKRAMADMEHISDVLEARMAALNFSERQEAYSISSKAKDAHKALQDALGHAEKKGMVFGAAGKIHDARKELDELLEVDEDLER